MRNRSMGILLVAALGFSVSPANSFYAKPLLISDVATENRYNLSDLDRINPSRVLEKSRNKQQLNSLERDFLQWQSIQSMSAESLSATELKTLETLSDYTSQAYRKHEEGSVAIAIFNVSDLAKFTLRQFEGHTVKRELQNNLRHHADLASVISGYKTDAQWLGLELWLRDFSSEQGMPITQQLHQASRTNARLMHHFHLSLYATADGKKSTVQGSQSWLPLYQAALEDGENLASAHNVLSSAKKRLNSSDLASLYQRQIMTKGALSSQALHLYGELERIDFNWVQSLLSDDKLGSSAALLLSKKVHELGDYSQQIRQSRSRIEVANSLLVLRLSQQDEAKHILRNLYEEQHIPFADMAQEVASWEL